MLNNKLSIDEFIVLGGFVSLAIVMSSKYFQFKDPSCHLELPDLPDTIDPYAVAYLRGGAHELTRLLVTSLVIKGLLRVGGSPSNSTIYSVDNPRAIDSLNRLEREIFDYFDRKKERIIREIFAATGAPYVIASFMVEFETQFHQHCMLATETEINQARLTDNLQTIFILTIVIILYLASGEKGWLFVLIIAMIWRCIISIKRSRRVNNLGERYLASIQGKIQLQEPSNIVYTSHSFILSVAVFGSDVLINTPYEFIKNVCDSRVGGNADGGEGAGGGGCGSACGGCGGGCGG